MQECFVVVYGEMPSEFSKRKLGVCGVCRQEMRLGEGGEKRKGGSKTSTSLSPFKAKFIMLTPRRIGYAHGSKCQRRSAFEPKRLGTLNPIIQRS